MSNIDRSLFEFPGRYNNEILAKISLRVESKLSFDLKHNIDEGFTCMVTITDYNSMGSNYHNINANIYNPWLDKIMTVAFAFELDVRTMSIDQLIGMLSSYFAQHIKSLIYEFEQHVKNNVVILHKNDDGMIGDLCTKYLQLQMKYGHKDFYYQQLKKKRDHFDPLIYPRH